MGLFSKLFGSKNEKFSNQKTNKRKRKKYEIALGAAFVSCINDTIQSLQSGHQTHKANLNKKVIVRTKGCQLKPNDLATMNTAAKIALDRALDVVSKNNASEKIQIVSELWSTTNNIEVSFSLTPDQKFVWSLDLD